MRPSPHDSLNRWLAAERDDRPDEAEAALFELFEALPLVAPPAGFADRVLARAGFLAAPASWFESRWVRVTIALCLLATGLFLLWLPAAVKALAGTWSPGSPIELAARLLVDWSLRLVAVLRLWDWFFTLGEALAKPLATPEVAAVLAGCLLVASLAFRFLRDLMTNERSWTYVDPV
ncbi:MAG TPA: hypothetical protein VLT87_09350 [Thermoanaerobaculia bacterium]|nr:hypothetical protein [Thermoanaerobaculia bacterium]